ncbi:hypothetical protein GCM10010390_19700 [Streptomyces mordarskii]|uniref:Uncharacterized protein n=1 Tax=Streptomyces mordarskii TaxID=1226758 RepID=A0ABN1CER8_9ACTN
MTVVRASREALRRSVDERMAGLLREGEGRADQAAPVRGTGHLSAAVPTYGSARAPEYRRTAYRSTGIPST